MEDIKKWYFDRVRPFYNNVIVIAFPRGSSKMRTQMKLFEYWLEKMRDNNNIIIFLR